MSIDTKLLDILRCPRSGQPLHPAKPAELEALRAALADGTLKDAAGAAAIALTDTLLVTDNQEWAYPIEQGVPVMLPDLALAVRSVLRAS